MEVEQAVLAVYLGVPNCVALLAALAAVAPLEIGKERIVLVIDDGEPTLRQWNLFHDETSMLWKMSRIVRHTCESRLEEWAGTVGPEQANTFSVARGSAERKRNFSYTNEFSRIHLYG
jgi:hypothetical protein